MSKAFSLTWQTGPSSALFYAAASKSSARISPRNGIPASLHVLSHRSIVFLNASGMNASVVLRRQRLRSQRNFVCSRHQQDVSTHAATNSSSCPCDPESERLSVSAVTNNDAIKRSNRNGVKNCPMVERSRTQMSCRSTTCEHHPACLGIEPPYFTCCGQTWLTSPLNSYCRLRLT